MNPSTLFSFSYLLICWNNASLISNFVSFTVSRWGFCFSPLFSLYPSTSGTFLIQFWHFFGDPSSAATLASWLHALFFLSWFWQCVAGFRSCHISVFVCKTLCSWECEVILVNRFVSWEVTLCLCCTGSLCVNNKSFYSYRLFSVQCSLSLTHGFVGLPLMVYDCIWSSALKWRAH